jgi:hypothetical protein
MSARGPKPNTAEPFVMSADRGDRTPVHARFDRRF